MYTTEAALVVVSVIAVAPNDALVAAVAPVPPAPLNAISVSDWWYELVTLWTEVTVPLVIGVAAVAVQISDVPNWVLERMASDHVRPAPVIESVCFGETLVGPAEVANTTSSSFAAVVVNAGVVTVPVASIDVVLSIERTPGAGGPVDTNNAIALPLTTETPAFGFWLTIEPVGTVVLDVFVTAPTTRPAFVIAVDAAACVSPTTFGTATCGGPDDTTSATALPVAIWVPAVGF